MRDRTDEVELSQDYEAKIVSDDRARIYNHIVALGRGEMLERTVVELWQHPDGTISETRPSGASDESTLLYDYPSVESREELVSAAKKKLLGDCGSGKLDIELFGYDDIGLELTDIASVRDNVTGMTAALRVTEKKLNISSSGVSITHTLG